MVRRILKYFIPGKSGDLSILLLLPMLLLGGCNPDVFIKPLEASQAEFEFPMTGGTAEVRLSHGDWILERVAVERVDVEGWVRPAEGKAEYVSLYLKGLGTATYQSQFHSFEIIRDKSDRITVNLDQSVDPDARLIELYLVNDYEIQVISIEIGGCCGYELDRVEYSEVTHHTAERYEKAWSDTVTNEAGNYLHKEWDVFNENAVRTVDFPANSVTSEDIPRPHWHAELVRYLDGNTFEMPLPSPYLDDGGIVLGGFSAPFVYGESDIRIDLPDEKVGIITEEAGTAILTVFWAYEEYSVNYTVWLKHEGGGKPLSFNGRMSSKAYTGKWDWAYNFQKQ